jgi:hypothetical protein
MYAFYSVLARSSPIGEDGSMKGWRGYDQAKNPALDRWLEERVWKVIRDREPWAGKAEYKAPRRSGSVRVRFEESSGQVTITITGRVTAVRLGSPAAKKMVPDRSPTIAQVGPIDADAEIYAWYDPKGLPEGTYDLGPLVSPGTAYEDLLFGYTPAEGLVAEMDGVQTSWK